MHLLKVIHDAIGVLLTRVAPQSHVMLTPPPSSVDCSLLPCQRSSAPPTRACLLRPPQVGRLKQRSCEVPLTFPGEPVLNPCFGLITNSASPWQWFQSSCFVASEHGIVWYHFLQQQLQTSRLHKNKLCKEWVRGWPVRMCVCVFITTFYSSNSRPVDCIRISYVRNG